MAGSYSRFFLGELIKLRSIRSLWLSLLSFVTISVGLSLLIGAGLRQAIDSGDPVLLPGFKAEDSGLDSIWLGAVAVLVFAVLSISQEYRSGMIGYSLLMQPTRQRFYLLKALFVGLVVSLLAVPVCVVGYLCVQAMLGPHGAPITEPGVGRAIVGAAGYLVLASLLGFGSASYTRNSVGPLVILVPVFLIGTQALSLIGLSNTITKFSPEQAGLQMSRVHPEVGMLSPAEGFVVLSLWTVFALAAGMRSTCRADV